MSSTSDSLQQRYGGPSLKGRIVIGVIGALAVLGLLVWIVWAIAGSADPAVSSQEVTKGHSQHRAWITYQIKYGDGPVHATCTVVALADDGEEVGRKEFAPPTDAEPDEAYKLTFRTTREPDSIDWQGCTAPGQKHPH